IFRYNNGWERLLSSHCAEDGTPLPVNIDVERDLLGFQDISFITTSTNPALSSYDIVIPVFNNNILVAYVLIGDIEEEQDGVSPVIKHLNFIQTLTNIIITAIENTRLFKESLKQAAIKKEMELARKMQAMLIPQNNSLPHDDRLSVSAFYHPHFDVGGDYYDVIKLDENELGFCIADVSGKGISAALLMSNFQATFRALLTKDVPLKFLLERLNERVIFNAKGEKFITFFIGRYNCKTREFEYVNAGHNPPLIFYRNTHRLDFLRSGCVGLGMLDDIPYIIRGTIRICEPVKILLYTDGLVELLEGENVSIGTKFLEEITCNDKSIKENINEIISLKSITDGNPAIFDDITMLGLEIY
ncbi:MAG TPA: PP2C family protein-serine/threonine phosphatase, partial [Bacteroidales bacterium]|nr:PP2C family protein-serine/threonine phosphatase [Bacteroidales bacterium]